MFLGNLKVLVARETNKEIRRLEFSVPPPHWLPGGERGWRLSSITNSQWSNPGVPNPLYLSRTVRNWATQWEVSLNVMCLNHPETILLLPYPWKNDLPWNRPLVPKKDGGHWYNQICLCDWCPHKKQKADIQRAPRLGNQKCPCAAIRGPKLHRDTSLFALDLSLSISSSASNKLVI